MARAGSKEEKNGKLKISLYFTFENHKIVHRSARLGSSIYLNYTFSKLYTDTLSDPESKKSSENESRDL